MKKAFIPYGRQKISQADINQVVKVLKSDFLTQGPEVEKFEASLAKYSGAKYCVVLNSGTAALHAAYFAAGLSANDEFITTPMTFAATANAGLYLGAKPVFVDINPLNGTIDPQKIEAKITKKTKIIVPVHYAGHPAEMSAIKRIAKKHGLLVVADACHALGAEYKGQKIGSASLADISVLSFHPVKHITTGEGGAILTNSKKYYQRAKQFLTHGITKQVSKYKFPNAGLWYHEMQYLGYNYRLTDIQATLGNSQLKKNERFLRQRTKLAKRYLKLMAESKYFDLIYPQPDIKHAYHLFPILLKKKYWQKKKRLFQKLHQLGIGIQVHYIPVYLHPYYRDLGYKPGLCPIAESFYKAEISIPLFPSLSNSDQDRVVAELQNSLK